MSTIKITELPALTTLSSNTSNTILVGVDIPTTTTSKITLTTIARDLYSNNTLAVGNNYTILPNVAGQFTGNSSNYVQVNLQNLRGNGSGDIVVTADVGDDSNYYIDLGLNGSTYNYPGYTYAKKLDGYLVVQGNVATPTANGGNLVIGTTTTGKDITFTQGATDETGQVAKFVYDTGFKLLKKPLYFADGTSQNSAVDYATVNSRISSNVAALRSEITTNNTTQSVYAQAAFAKANSALQNTSGTLTGSLEVTGNLSSLYAIQVRNPSMSGNTPYVVVTGTTGNAIGTPSNPGYTFHSATDTGNRIAAESYGTGSSVYAAFIGRRGRGTAASPSAVQNGDIILRLGGNGYGATKFSQFSDARVEFVATETHTDSSKGTQIQFWTTPSGSNTATQIGTLTGNTVTFTGTVNPAKGFVYSANVLNTLTSLGLDFSRDNLVKFNVNDNASITLSNYVTGKVVEVWITNSAAQNKTITHGCLANNSTAKATSFTIQAGACAYLRYFSIDGDQANTFVSINA